MVRWFGFGLTNRRTMLLAFVAYLLVFLSLCWAQAPGDEDDRCTVNHSNPPQYPDNVRNLMDSYNYENLLPGNGTGNSPIATAVWNDFSFDGNDVTPETLSPTYWQQGAGGICRFQTRVCGWRQNGVVVSQNNWLFTQHISSDFDSNIYNYDVTIHVKAIYSLQSCRERQGCRQRFNLLHYMTNSQQLPSTSGNGYINTQNYENFAVPEGPVSSVTYTNTYNFPLPPSSTGFYIAVQDIGACIALSRLRVYRNNCKSRQVGLVLYPDAPAPESGSENIDIGCVENAVVSGSPRVTCGTDGTWGSQSPVCQCKCGYEPNSEATKCNACPAGQWSDGTVCLQCPANTKTTPGVACSCSCKDGYFRNNETSPEKRQFENPVDEGFTYECTKPPSAPSGVLLSATNTSITITWSDPADLGERTDLYYQAEISDPDNLGSYTGTLFLRGSTTIRTISSLRPHTLYCVRVTSHNGVSDQDPDREHLRTVEECTTTLEARPGMVSGVQGTYPYVVWNPPEEPNGVITDYRLTFTCSGSTNIINTMNDQTFYAIQQSDSPCSTGSVTITVSAVNSAGAGPSSEPFDLPINCIVCPAQSVGLVRYNTTLAPASGSVTVTTQCADNAHVKNGFSLIVTCTSTGSWSGTTPQCECDTGYLAVTVSGRQICQTQVPDPPSIGAVNETKVLGCGVISWKPPPGNEGLKLSYVVRFFDGSTYDTTSTSGYRRIQRNSEIGRQWTRVNDIPDGRTVYADIRAVDTSGRVGPFSKKFVVANSTLCSDNCDVCQAKSVGLVRYNTTLAPASGSVTVTTQCADNAHRTGSSLNVTCTSTGRWSSTTPQCECDTGYEEDDNKCRANPCNITGIPEQDLDLKIAYGYVHLSWDTVALETTLVFYEESENKPVYTDTTTDDYYHLQINTDEWLVDINDETTIIVQINNQARERRETENSTSTTFEFTKKKIREELDRFRQSSECVTRQRQPDTESVVDGTSLAIAIVLTFVLTAAAVVFLSISLGLVLHKRSEMKREKSSKTANGDVSLSDYDEQKTSSY